MTVSILHSPEPGISRVSVTVGNCTFLIDAGRHIPNDYVPPKPKYCPSEITITRAGGGGERRYRVLVMNPKLTALEIFYLVMDAALFMYFCPDLAEEGETWESFRLELMT